MARIAGNEGGLEAIRTSACYTHLLYSLMPQINFRVGPDLHQRFQAMCEERGKTITEVLSEAMVAFVERDMAAKEPHPVRIPPVVALHAADLPTWPPRSGYGERLKKDKGSK